MLLGLVGGRPSRGTPSPIVYSPSSLYLVLLLIIKETNE